MPKEMKDAEIDEGQIAQVEAVILSMTPAERDEPSLISGSRRTRIAKGSGTTTTQVNQLLKQFSQMRTMMKAMMGEALGEMSPKSRKNKGKKGKKKPSKTSMMRNAMAMQKEMKKNPGSFDGLLGSKDMSCLHLLIFLKNRALFLSWPVLSPDHFKSFFRQLDYLSQSELVFCVRQCVMFVKENLCL